METIVLLGTILGIGFVSGLNLYATVLAIGIGLNLGVISLPPHLAGLEILGHPAIITVAAIVYTVEFFADKVPWLDNAWDSVHTFIRPLGAAFIAMAAVSDVNPVAELAIMLLCGSVALSTHATKASARVAVNTSPEPFSNIVVSTAEDVVAVGGTWLAFQYPLVMLAIVVVFMVFFTWMAPKMWRLLRAEMGAMAAVLRRMLGWRQRATTGRLIDAVPAHLRARLPEAPQASRGDFSLSVLSGRGLKIGRNLRGNLCRIDGRLHFVTRKWWRNRLVTLGSSAEFEVTFISRLLMNRVILHGPSGDYEFYIFKDRAYTGEELLEIMKPQPASMNSDPLQSPAMAR